MAIRLRNFGSAAAFFARVLFSQRINKIPPRIIGEKRRRISSSTIVLEAWKTAALRRKINPKSFLLMESFASYISRVDDLLDKPSAPKVSTHKVQYYKKDALSRQWISGFVSRAREMLNSQQITKSEFNELIRIAGNLRKMAWESLERFESIKQPVSLAEIRKHREETAGQMGAALASILNICERVPLQERKSIEETFANCFMAVQIADDITDAKVDFRENTESIALAVLKNHHSELNAVLNARKLALFAFRKLAPQSSMALMQLANEYIERIPKTEGGEVMKSIIRAFLKAHEVYRLKKN